MNKDRMQTILPRRKLTVAFQTYNHIEDEKIMNPMNFWTISLG